MEVGNIKGNIFPSRERFWRDTKIKIESVFFQHGPVEVISAVNVVVAEETFTVKCFLTMMAPEV